MPSRCRQDWGTRAYKEGLEHGRMRIYKNRARILQFPDSSVLRHKHIRLYRYYQFTTCRSSSSHFVSCLRALLSILESRPQTSTQNRDLLCETSQHAQQFSLWKAPRLEWYDLCALIRGVQRNANKIIDTLELLQWCSRRLSLQIYDGFRRLLRFSPGDTFRFGPILWSIL